MDGNPFWCVCVCFRLLRQSRLWVPAEVFDEWQVFGSWPRLLAEVPFFCAQETWTCFCSYRSHEYVFWGVAVGLNSVQSPFQPPPQGLGQLKWTAELHRSPPTSATGLNASVTGRGSITRFIGCCLCVKFFSINSQKRRERLFCIFWV